MKTATTTWTERLTVGEGHERHVQSELQRRGWTVSPYGQGVLADPIRQALKRTESRMRWDPDMVASQGSTVCLIDAKTSVYNDEAWTYNIQRKALRAGLRMHAELDLPVYYVFANLGVATPWEIMQFCHIATVGEAGGYLSIPAGAPRPFDEVFGGPSDCPPLGIYPRSP